VSYDSIVNRGDYLSAHYLAEVLPRELKKPDGLLARWAERKKAGEPTPLTGLRDLRSQYFADRPFFADYADRLSEDQPISPDDLAAYGKTLRELHGGVLRALGFEAAPRELTVERAAKPYAVTVAHAEQNVVAIDCGWAADADAALDPDRAGQLLALVPLDNREQISIGAKLASWLFAADEPPRYVLLLMGGVVVLADRATWGDGRYLAVSLDVAFGRRNPAELEIIAALFSADALLPPAEGGAEPMAGWLAGSRQHAVGVSSELREGLRQSVQIIANEVLDRIRKQGARPEQIMEPAALAREIGKEALRYLYRILFLLYAEARPELGILPVDDEDYIKGYSMARLGDLVVRNLVGEDARTSFHLYESIDLLVRMINEGYPPRVSAARDSVAAEGASTGEGIRFEPLRADLFEPSRTRLIGRDAIVMPGSDEDDPDAPRVDTRLRDEALYRVLRLLMLTRGKGKGRGRAGRTERGGFISYAQLGIGQLGAVYEGLMSYTGFIADEELYEVAKDGNASGGSWMIPASKVASYPDDVFVLATDEDGRKTGEYLRYRAGAFVYRLAGRDRQTSASYYTPESLTQVTVQLAVKQRIEEEGREVTARDVLSWRICEPALGSGAFLNEAINQVAAEYLRRREAERGARLEPDERPGALQRAKAYIALHNCYGVDLNETAVELAEVSIWLNVMHPGLQAPWFGLHLVRGNSLIGAGRRLYAPEHLAKGAWLTSAPEDHPFSAGPVPDGAIHHFLLPAQGWGAVAGEKEAKDLAPEDAKRLGDWRRALRKPPSDKKARGSKLSQVQRLQALARRSEYLWGLVAERLRISEQEISRAIDVWGAEDLPRPAEAVSREKILKDLTTAGTPFWRLKTLMDTWCALWFWPLDKAGLLDGSHEVYERLAKTITNAPPPDISEPESPAVEQPSGFPVTWEMDSLFGDSPRQGVLSEALTPAAPRPQKKRPATERRPVVPLADLGDWLEFAEALLGRQDIPVDSLAAGFTKLDELEQYEDKLESQFYMDMDSVLTLAERFPWLGTAEDIARQQGFFHWELQFAQVFAHGGFDIQVGNPPWVRPIWDEGAVLAEFDPWFELADKPPVEAWQLRKKKLLGAEDAQHFFLREVSEQAATAAFFASPATYPLLVGTQPDFYRAFMIRTWANIGRSGISGLLHPDTHFVGDREKSLRAVAYSRLRVHGDFVNSGNRFFPPPVNRSSHFGLHIYGQPKSIRFAHLSWLLDAAELTKSLALDEAGELPEGWKPGTELPGVKYNGDWDQRPHPARVIWVDSEMLATWRLISGHEDLPVEQTKLLYPVTTDEQGAIIALGMIDRRLGEFQPRISSGYHESGAKKDGLIRWELGDPEDWSEVILKGPQIGVATPFFKQPPNTGTKGRPQDLSALDDNALPRSEYARAADLETYRAAQDLWVDYRQLATLLDSPEEVAGARAELANAQGVAPAEITEELIEAYLSRKTRRRYTDFYRLLWREMIPHDTDRSLFAALFPPGLTHIHAVRSMALSAGRDTALVAGFWTALPVDYLLRITGREHLDVANARVMPAPQPDHRLAAPLLLRALRLNCLTGAYTDLWAELYEETWQQEEWAVNWPHLKPLGDVGPAWARPTPLRTEYERRAALVEIDALVAVWLGITAEQLSAIYRARYPILGDYERVTWFDANGRKIAGNWNTFGTEQTKEYYEQLTAHLADEVNVPPPDGYEPPFYKADREGEMREAHAVFTERLRRAREGQGPGEGGAT
jgi:hypothetical protein